jgi:hypothetical protein
VPKPKKVGLNSPIGDVRPRRTVLNWECLFDIAGDGEYRPPMLAIRDIDWKAFAEPNGSRVELYDITRDPGGAPAPSCSFVSIRGSSTESLRLGATGIFCRSL